MVIETLNEQQHVITQRVYDDSSLELVGTMIYPAPGWQLNGHRADCRCEICRPDIWRLPSCASG